MAHDGRDDRRLILAGPIYAPKPNKPFHKRAESNEECWNADLASLPFDTHSES